uniref:Uncharacterized protein n=1 Tax=Romanomermis culicivorax TaxID=13658 RepID=A0A915KEI4_ROMCU
MNNKVFVELTVDVNHQPSISIDHAADGQSSKLDFDLRKAASNRRKSSSFCGEIDFREIELQHVGLLFSNFKFLISIKYKLYCN